jgi:hypothetical protein
VQDPTISLLDPRRFFGVTSLGFTKANELFVGRMAQLGFAAALIGEVGNVALPAAAGDVAAVKPVCCHCVAGGDAGDPQAGSVLLSIGLARRQLIAHNQ